VSLAKISIPGLSNSISSPHMLRGVIRLGWILLCRERSGICCCAAGSGGGEAAASGVLLVGAAASGCVGVLLLLKVPLQLQLLVPLMLLVRMLPLRMPPLWLSILAVPRS
jgi:hypothetical protein